MNLSLFRTASLFGAIAGFLLLIFFSANFSACQKKTDCDTCLLLDWNLHFGTVYDSHGRDTMRQRYEQWINHYVDSALSPTAFRRIRWSYCPCDSSLANVFAEVGTSGSTIPNPPPTPKPGPTGDYSLTTNFRINIPEATHADRVKDSGKIAFDGDPNADTTTLAVIDTGLDTVLLNGTPTSIIWAHNMLWTDIDGRAIFNVVPGESITSLNDDSHVKHGTSATALALKQFGTGKRPRIMTIRSFDNDGKGSIYTVSCAMSYAIQKHVTAINASWGYEAENVDTVLASYFELAYRSNIPVFAAAGNDPHEPHNPPYDPNVIIPTNELTPRHLFFPACLSREYQNILTVTGINKPTSTNTFIPCRYQYYSKAFVNLGVLNESDCCTYNLPFHFFGVEGTSFATPVAAGQIMQILPRPLPGMAFNLQGFVHDHVMHYGLPFYNQDGNYITYKNISP